MKEINYLSFFFNNYYFLYDLQFFSDRKKEHEV